MENLLVEVETKWFSHKVILFTSNIQSLHKMQNIYFKFFKSLKMNLRKISLKLKANFPWKKSLLSERRPKNYWMPI